MTASIFERQPLIRGCVACSSVIVSSSGVAPDPTLFPIRRHSRSDISCFDVIPANFNVIPAKAGIALGAHRAIATPAAARWANTPRSKSDSRFCGNDGKKEIGTLAFAGVSDGKKG
jgi:hypothetical protein